MAITTQTLDTATFARKVIEYGLKVVGPIGGRLFAAKAGTKEGVIYETQPENPLILAATANPAGGADYASIVTPPGMVRVYHAFRPIVITDGTVVDRFFQVFYNLDGTNVFTTSARASAIPATTTAARTFALNSPVADADFGNFMPEIEVPAGGEVDVLLAAMVAGDDNAVMRYAYTEREVP